MLKKLCLCILLASLMTACTFGESQNDLQQSSQDQAPLESHDEEDQSEYSSDATEEINPNANQSSAVDSSEDYIYDEQALDAEIECLYGMGDTERLAGFIVKKGMRQATIEWPASWNVSYRRCYPRLKDYIGSKLFADHFGYIRSLERLRNK